MSAPASYRIAMIAACPYPVPQGSQVLLHDTATALRTRGHDVHLVVYGYGIGPEPEGIPIHRCRNLPGARRTKAGPSWAKPLLDLDLVRTLRRVIRQCRIDIVHAHNYEGLLAALLAGHRPIVYHAHNAMADELPHYFPFGNALGAFLDRQLPRRASHIIVHHQRLADYLTACGCGANRISVFPPPCNAGLFHADPIGATIPPILYAGNLDPYQNLGLLFRAMKHVREGIPDARLLIATSEEAQLPGAETIRVQGASRIEDIMAQDAVFACPRTSWSGYPIKLLNAMASGKAIVACQSAAYPIIHEETGLIVPDNDEEAFAHALIRLMTNHGLRARLGKSARATAEATHAPASYAAAIEGLYDSLLRP